MEKLQIYTRAAIGAAAGGALATLDHALDNPAEIIANPGHALKRAAIGAAVGILMMLAKGSGIRASAATLRGKS